MLEISPNFGVIIVIPKILYRILHVVPLNLLFVTKETTSSKLTFELDLTGTYTLLEFAESKANGILEGTTLRQKEWEPILWTT